MKHHDSAITHVQGSSEFVDDRPMLAGELHVAVVYSPHAHAEILSIDVSDALQVEGVVTVLTAKDLYHNLWGTIFQDQPLLADKKVCYVGEPIALIAAENKECLRVAKKKIQIQYKILPAISTISQAVKEKSFIGFERKIERGQVDQAFEKVDFTIKDKIVIQGADHFYLESQACIAYPKEQGQIEIHSSSQHPTEVQHVVCHGLGLQAKDVVVVVKRMGGGFGGKESQAAPIAAFAALVAQKTNRPARLILSKDDDMIMTGKRNPFENTYQVGFNKNGEIKVLDVMLYSNGGAYADLSTSIMERAMLHIDNAYYIENLRVRGHVCRLHQHPHTAFRGFGGPKGVATIEKIIEQISFYLKSQGIDLDPLEIRKINCYDSKNGRDITPYGQKVENNCLPKILNDLAISSKYFERRKEIEKNNQEILSDWKNKPYQADCCLRGLSLTPVKFGISFTTRFLNQGNALVIVNRDGSVQISTGATEMGQGVNARIATMVAEELGLPMSTVRVMPTSTEKNANTSPTAASSGTDLNGAAALIAARKIKARLSQVAKVLFDLPEDRWARVTAGLGTEQEIIIDPEVYKQLQYGDDGNAYVNASDMDRSKAGNEKYAEFLGIGFKDGYIYLNDTLSEDQNAKINEINQDTSNRKNNRRLKFSDVTNEAYLNRVSLSDYAHYRIPNLHFNKLTGVGQAFMYFTQGAAVSEVSVNIHTGELKVQDVQILMDLGRPVMKELDLGQVSGAFIQGMGWVTTENLVYSDQGKLLSHSPSTYKIPSVQDIPRKFKIELFHNDENTVNVRGTKAVGEPPLLLALSVWAAVQDAMKSVHRNFPTMIIPATQEQVLRSLYPEKFTD